MVPVSVLRIVRMTLSERKNISVLISQFGVFSLHGFQNVSHFSHGFGSGSLSSPVMLACHSTFHFRSLEAKSTAWF